MTSVVLPGGIRIPTKQNKHNCLIYSGILMLKLFSTSFETTASLMWRFLKLHNPANGEFSPWFLLKLPDLSMLCAQFMINPKKKNLIKKSIYTHYYRENVSLCDGNSSTSTRRIRKNSQNASSSEHVVAGFVIITCSNFWRSKTIKDSINSDDALLTSSLAFIFINTTTLLKIVNESYCSDAPAEKS